MDGYSLTRSWFSFAFSNPSKVRPPHGILYLWLVELNNRNGWAKEFKAPADLSMNACGIHSYNVYIATLRDLIDWGFVKMILKSVNQYTPNIVALSDNDTPLDAPIDKALIIASSKQSESTYQSTDSNIKPLNKETNKPKKQFVPPTILEVKLFFSEKGYSEESAIRAFNHYDIAEWTDTTGKKVVNWKQKMNTNWLKPENLKIKQQDLYTAPSQQNKKLL